MQRTATAGANAFGIQRCDADKSHREHEQRYQGIDQRKSWRR
jgi:hypothetical protein